MPALLWVVAVIFGALLASGLVLLLWIRSTGFTAAEGAAELKSIGMEVVRLPGKLRALARDERVPRQVRWMLIGLAIYIASPIDPIPDFLPGIGYLDELIIVPFALRAIRRRIPDEVWEEYLPPRQRIGSKTRAERSGSDISGSSGKTGR
jgi:uncharacterized membrane protein YkvA (DUF1232 family)